MRVERIQFVLVNLYISDRTFAFVERTELSSVGPRISLLFKVLTP
jgi:hypothetical protein